jgi:hypothetical protein
MNTAREIVLVSAIIAILVTGDVEMAGSRPREQPVRACAILLTGPTIASPKHYVNIKRVEQGGCLKWDSVRRMHYESI